MMITDIAQRQGTPDDHHVRRRANERTREVPVTFVRAGLVLRSRTTGLSKPQPAAATTVISTRRLAEASLASTVVRAGAVPGLTHCSHTSFIAAKSPMSRR